VVTHLSTQETTIASRSSAATPFEDIDTPSRVLLRPTSTQQVADYIRRQIFEGKLRVGDRVPQDEIAADLGVSRVPVREAVIALDREGWVMIQAHRGAFVVGLDENSTRDHYDAFPDPSPATIPVGPSQLDRVDDALHYGWAWHRHGSEGSTTHP